MGNYVPNTKEERQAMLEEIGFQSFDDLFKHIPEEVKLNRELNLPDGLSELDVKRTMAAMAKKNKVYPTIFRGAGAYRHYIPSIVKSVLSKENLQTTYTPYQAELSQGILQSIYEFQTLICDLTGMDVANASVYDGATAAAESVFMCYTRKRKKTLVSAAVQPGVLETIKTYTFGNDMELVIVPEKDGRTDLEALKAALDEQTASVYIQQPNFYGNIEDGDAISALAHEAGAKLVVGVNPISLGVLKKPSEYGADIACGEGQPLGLPIAFGGPYIGFMASTKDMMRQLPGRIVGATKDKDGKTGYVLTLQAREQHIRREKASSNICSNQALCALCVGVYLSSMGNRGLEQAAVSSMSKAHYFAEGLVDAGLKLVNEGAYFHEFVTTSEVPAARYLEALDKADILGGLPLDEHRILWCCTELNTKAEMDEVIRIVKEVR